jgi:hypothetical protein
MENLTPDQKRFDNFYEILSEDDIKNMSVDFESSGGQFGDWLIDTLKKYQSYKDNTMAHYDNKEIEKEFSNLNNIFGKLYDFIFKNVRFVEVGVGMKYVLLPELRESEDPKDVLAWKKIEEEVDSYFRGFLNVYKQFLKKYRQIISEKQNVNSSQKPHTETGDGFGYLIFNKGGEKIKIGGIDSQPFRLLRCLTEPFGNPKSIDAVFESIRENTYKKSKTGTYSSIMDKPKKVRTIEYAIKELQKGNKLKGRLKFKWDELKTKLRLEYIA